MKVFLFNKNEFSENAIEDETIVRSKVELLNRSLEKEDRYTVIVAEQFPPVGKVFEKGLGLRDKNEKEQVASGEIAMDAIKQRVIDKINELCQKNIISGFESNALGDVYIYDSEDVDQLNLIGAVASGGSVAYKCTCKADGVRKFYTHTNTQIKKVLGDAAARKIALLQIAYTHKTAIASLNDYDSIVGYDINKGW